MVGSLTEGGGVRGWLPARAVGLTGPDECSIGRALLYSTIHATARVVTTVGRRAAMTLRDNRFSVDGGSSDSGRSSPNSDRDVVSYAASDGIVGSGRAAGNYPNGCLLGYDPPPRAGSRH